MEMNTHSFQSRRWPPHCCSMVVVPMLCQLSCSQFGRGLTLTLIARRSRCFAGTRCVNMMMKMTMMKMMMASTSSCSLTTHSLCDLHPSCRVVLWCVGI